MKNDQRQQLAAVLGMLGSQHDGEVLNAARLAERLRKKLNRSWPQLLDGTAQDTTAELRVAEERARAAEAAEEQARAAAAAAEERTRAAEASVLGLADLVSTLRAELRALRARSDARELQAKVNLLTMQIASLQHDLAQAKNARPAAAAASSHAEHVVGSKFDLDQATEDKLITKLLNGEWSSFTVKAITGWDTPKMSIRDALERIAKKRGLKLRAKSIGDSHLVFSFHR